MASSIQLLRSTVSQERPFAGNLLDGQPAININQNEPGLFFKLSDGTVAKIGPAAITSDGSPPNASAAGAAGNSIGELWLDKSLVPPVLKVYDGAAWIDAGSGGGGGGGGTGTFLRWIYTAIGGETSLSGTSGGVALDYTPGVEEVFVNGVLITRGVDYSAINGSSITNLVPLTAGDVVTVTSMNPVSTIALPGQASISRWSIVAPTALTVLSGSDSFGVNLAYTPGLEQVFINGVFQTRGVDYTATNGTTISLAAPLIIGDDVSVQAWSPISSTPSPSPSPSVTLLRWSIAATAGQTLLSGNDSQGNPLSYTAGLEEVFVNGAFLRRGTDYTATDGSSITLTAPLTVSDEVTVLGFSPLTIGSVPGSSIIDGTITSAKIQDGSIIDADVNASAEIASTKLSYQSILGGSIAVSVRNKLSETVSVKDFGATGGGGVNDQPAIQAALNSGATRIIFPAGTYKVNSELSKTLGSTRLELIGEGEVIIDGSSLGASTEILSISGTLGSNFSQVGPIDIGENTFTIPSGMNLAVGDIVRIQSTDLWSAARNYFYKGELVKIRSITGSTATIDGSFYDSYTPATTTLNRIQAPSVLIENIKFVRPASDSTTLDTVGLKVEHCKDTVLRRVRSEYSNYSGLIVTQCYNVLAEDCEAVGNFITGQGLDYGIAIASSNTVTVRGGYYVTGRHGITHGGTFPFRDCLVDGAYVDNISDTTVAFDTHQAGQNIRVTNCTIMNGAYIGSIDTSFENNTVKTRDPGPNAGLYVNPVKSCSYIAIRNNVLDFRHGSPTTEGRSLSFRVSGVNSPATTVAIDNLIIEGNTLLKPTATGGSPHAMLIRGSIFSDCPVTINSLLIKNNLVNVAAGFGITFLADNASAALFQILESYVEGNRLEAANTTFDMVASANFTFGDIFLRKNTFETNSASQYSVDINSSGASVIVADDNMFKGGIGAFLNNSGGVVKASDNIFRSGTNSLVIGAGGTIGEAVIGNNYDFTAGGFSNVGTNFTSSFLGQGGNSDSQRVAWRTAIPTTGTWNVGDIVWNTTPAAGGIPGWICVTAGTPGTWKAMAAIAA